MAKIFWKYDNFLKRFCKKLSDFFQNFLSFWDHFCHQKQNQRKFCKKSQTTDRPDLGGSYSCKTGLSFFVALIRVGEFLQHLWLPGAQGVLRFGLALFFFFSKFLWQLTFLNFTYSFMFLIFSKWCMDTMEFMDPMFCYMSRWLARILQSMLRSRAPIWRRCMSGRGY